MLFTLCGLCVSVVNHSVSLVRVPDVVVPIQATPHCVLRVSRDLCPGRQGSECFVQRPLESPILSRITAIPGWQHSTGGRAGRSMRKTKRAALALLAMIVCSCSAPPETPGAQPPPEEPPLYDSGLPEDMRPLVDQA